MTRYANIEKIEPILGIAAEWKRDCLLGGRSVFQPGLQLWTHENMLELEKRLPDEDATNTSILSTLEKSLESAPVELKKLAAEVYWVQYLCPYQSPSAETKRNDILKIWGWSEDRLPQDDARLTDELLRGLGGPLQSFLTYRGKELRWLVAGFSEILALPRADREKLLSDPSECTRKLTAISGSTRRHSRHMLVFLLFPDERERSFSSGHRRKIAKKFSNVSPGKIDKMPEDQLDELLFTTRKRLERERGIETLDWYENQEIAAEWGWRKGDDQKEPDGIEDVHAIGRPSNGLQGPMAKNVIYYGPPGTGKTYRLNQIRDQEYITRAGQIDESDYFVSLFESWELRWWEVVVLALGDFESEKKGSKRPKEIYEHPYIKAQGKRRSGNSSDFNFRSVVPGMLRCHQKGAEESKYFQRPAVFHSENEGKWCLIPSWREEMPYLVDKLVQLQSGIPHPAEDKIVSRSKYVTFHQSYSYEDFIEGIRPVPQEDGEGVVYDVVKGVFLRICEEAKKDPKHRYAIFIDEINRGNISKIFGELITLLESDKRVRYDENGNRIGDSGMVLILPYSGKPFGVPENLDVYGAMNTADRSLVQLDTALRRRFDFVELMPDVNRIKGANGEGIIEDGEGGEINLQKLLKAMNRRIWVLHDREHMIGHSYFMKVKSFEDLQQVMQCRVLPLLQEYFHKDCRRIQLVLRDHDGAQPHPHQIVRDEPAKELDIPGFEHDNHGDQGRVYCEIAQKITPAAIRKVYEP